jgi:hypothetical protein
MPGLVPGIHVLCAPLEKQVVDGRDTPGHDGGATMVFATHCHGKPLEIKPEQLGSSA